MNVADAPEDHSVARRDVRHSVTSQNRRTSEIEIDIKQEYEPDACRSSTALPKAVTQIDGTSAILSNSEGSWTRYSHVPIIKLEDKTDCRNNDGNPFKVETMEMSSDDIAESSQPKLYAAGIGGTSFKQHNYEEDQLNQTDKDAETYDVALLRHASIEKPFICKTCDKSFALSSALTKHHRIHTGEKPFVCKICEKSFAQSTDLNTHQRIHTGEKPFVCKTCDSSFTQCSNLRTHQRTHTGEKPFVCKMCDKSFAQSGDMTKHQRMHTGEKPFVCKTCDKSCARSDNLSTHQRIHTDKKPFICEICDKAFAQSAGMIRHQRIHTGEKPFACKSCDKCFSQSSNLVKHKRTHTVKTLRL